MTISVAVGCSEVQNGTGPDGSADAAEPPVPPLVLANKVDLLLMVDNSASMGDKQAILADVVPELLRSLVSPSCVDPDGRPVGTLADPKGNRGNHFNCPLGSTPRWQPVSDLHIGIISSSLGSFGGDVCPDTGRTNDKGHLLNVTKAGSPAPEAAASGFLSWFPINEDNADSTLHPAPARPIGDQAALTASFQKMVVGVDQTGCGLEAQLESVYRFLVQPDPWVRVSLDAANQADLGAPGEIDVQLLQQRADFLREDSMVAIVALTDEDDSSVDPLSVGGQGWAFMATQFPGSQVFRADGKTTTAPRATSACAVDPNSADCTSCGFAASCNPAEPACVKIKSDPECQKNGGYYGPAEDQLNVRFHRMKERFGVDPQYPIGRYVDGLSKSRVPDRSTEHAVTLRDPANPQAGRDISAYQGTVKCTNPLFAKNLPRNGGDERCTLERGSRNPGLVFFAVIGGVPNQLLHFVADDPERSRLTTEDWNAILGADPARYDYSGIDPHMVASTVPRPGLPPPSSTRGDNGDPADPAGREWNTNADDLQYACTFALPAGSAHTCTAQDPSCDCAGATNPPLCGAVLGEQTRAKAYPTLRELMVARALGDQGVVASLCPLTLTTAKNDPSYGYNPAVAGIVEQVRRGLR